MLARFNCTQDICLADEANRGKVLAVNGQLLLHFLHGNQRLVLLSIGRCETRGCKIGRQNTPPDNFASEDISYLPNSVLSDTSAILIHWQADEPHPRNQSPIPTYIVHYTLLSDGVK